ncbi:hypothetical protein, partial [Sessilibacter corallicola]|uniref:hypothetical protein n=1 Tax=Sessilibacter corallicola TaxID=2904075 RepID=UPI003DA7899E
MKLKISGSVGRKGKNSPNDVKLIKALLNIYNRHLGTKTPKIDEKPSEDLTTNIENFQKAIVKMNKPDGQVTSSNSGSFRAL